MLIFANSSRPLSTPSRQILDTCAASEQRSIFENRALAYPRKFSRAEEAQIFMLRLSTPPLTIPRDDR